MTQTERITYMEHILDEALASLRTKQGFPERLDAIDTSVKELEAYYTSPLWKQDYDDDRAGRLPSTLKRGVLSEDAIYNLLTDWDASRKRI